MSEKSTQVIALVDDHPVVIEGMKSLLKTYRASYEVISFPTGKDLIEYIKDHPVDLVMLDIHLSDSNGIAVCKEIKALRNETVVIGLSNLEEPSIILQLLENGASGFLLKSTPADEILRSMDAALADEIVMSNEVKKIVFRSQKQMPSLTKRETQLLQLLAKGKTTAAIADELFLSPYTVDTYRKNLLRKFEVKNTAALLTLLIKEKKIPDN